MGKSQLAEPTAKPLTYVLSTGRLKVAAKWYHFDWANRDTSGALVSRHGSAVPDVPVCGRPSRNEH